MTLSRTLLFALALPSTVSHAAEQLTAEQALINYRAVTAIAPTACAAARSPDEIVVCANRLRETQKVPFIEELRVGDRQRLIAGEVPRAAGGGGRPCPPRGCPGGGSIFGAIGKIIERIRD